MIATRFIGDGKRAIRAWLEGAQSWACALGLAAEPAVHLGWEENAKAVLVASADPWLNAQLSTRSRHTREHDQLDLFIDSAQTAAVTARPFEAAVAATAGAVSPLPATERSMRAFIFAIAPAAGARSSVMTGTLAQNSS